MSTKIYNGIKFKNPNLYKIFNDLNQLKPQILKIGETQKNSQISKELVNIVDFLSSGLITPSLLESNDTNDQYYLIDGTYVVGSGLPGHYRSIVSKLLSDFDRRNQEIEKTQRRDPSVDVEFSLTIHPINKNLTLGIYFCENRNMIEHFLNSDIVEDYHYQNSTDPPKTVTTKQWNKRRRDWDVALDDTGIPERNSFTMKLCNYNWLDYGCDYELLLKHLPSYEQRIKTVSEEFLWLDYKKTKQKTTFSDYFDFSSDFKNGKFDQEFQIKCEEIKLKLLNQEELIQKYLTTKS